MLNNSEYNIEFKEFINMLPCAVYVIKESKIIECNKAALDIFGYDDKTEIIGLTPYELSPNYQDDGRLSFVKGERIINEAISGKDNISFLWKHMRKNKETFICSVSIFNKEGILYTLITDISENTKLKDDLHEKEYLYRMLFENHGNSLLVIDAKTGNIIKANEAAINYYGYSKEKLLSMNINEINILSDLDIKKEMATAIDNDRNFFKFKHKLSNNTLREVEVHSFPVKDKKHDLLYSIIYDVDDKIRQELMFDKLMLASPYAVVVLDKNQKIVNANDNFVNLFKYTIEEIQGNFINDLVSLDENKLQVDDNIQKSYNGQIVKQEGKRKCKDGKIVDVEIIGYPVLFHNEVIGVYIIYIDISNKKLYEEQLNLFKKILENNTEGVFITDALGCVEWVNNAFTSITGFLGEEIINDKTNILRTGIQDEAFYEKIWQQLLKTGTWKGEVLNKNKNGTVFAEWLSITSIKNDNNITTHYVGIIKDLSEKKNIDKRMNELQLKDPLTGLFNRKFLIGVIDKHIELYKKNKEGFSIIVIDIDEFREINDSLDYNFGNKLLVEVTNRILSSMKESSFLARIDGDEFAIFFNEADKNNINYFCINLLNELNKPYRISSNIIHLNFHIGISIFPCDTVCSDTLIRFANIAINKSKKSIEKRICFYTNEISSEVSHRFHLANYLFSAISNNELSVYYQPIFDITEGKIVGAEALIRWENPILGSVSPDKFIPVAEKTGQILAIGEWVIESVCKQIYLWNLKGYKLIPISINVSVKQLEQFEFAKKVVSIIRRENIDPRLIELEITESVSSGDILKIVDNIKQFKMHGIKISMDDFGTGFSSLGQLDIFELDKLKIDKIFINDLGFEIKKHKLIKTIIAMANSLDLVTVAEGIETDEQLLYLKDLGCHLGQGYLFSEPIPVYKIELLFDEKAV